MLKIYNKDNSLIVEGINNGLYIDNGQNSYPLNSLIVVVDDSDIVTFRSAATNDVLFSGVIENITINGEAVTKDNIIAKFDAVSNVEAGGGSGGGMTDEEREELKNLRGDVENALGDISALEIDKQDKLKSGENIKTVNGESLLGEGNIEIQGGDEHFEYVGDRDLMSDKGQGVFIVDSYKSYIPGHDIQGIRVVQSESQVEPIQNSDYLYEIDPYIVGAELFVSGWSGQVNIATVYADRIVFKAENVSDIDSLYEVAYFVNGVKVKGSRDLAMDFTLNIGDSFVAVDELYGWRNGFDNLMSTASMPSAIQFRGTETTASLNANQQLIYKDKNKTQHNVALQDQLKTINNQSIVGTGNITISAQVTDVVKSVNSKKPTTTGNVTLALSDIDSNVAGKYKVNTTYTPTPVSDANDVSFYNWKQTEKYVETNVGHEVDAVTQAFLCIREYDENQWTKFDCDTYAYFYDYSWNQVAQVDGKNIILYDSFYDRNDKIYYSEIWEDGVKIKERNSGERVTLKSGKKYVFVNPNIPGQSIFSDVDPMNQSNYVYMTEIIVNSLQIQNVRRTYKDAFQFEYNGKSYNILNEGNVKTINGESIYGDGNIEIESGAKLPAGNYLAKFEQNGGQIDFTQRGFDGLSEEIKSITLKTVNGQSLFGMGDIKVEGGGSAEPTVHKLNENIRTFRQSSSKYGFVKSGSDDYAGCLEGTIDISKLEDQNGYNLGDIIEDSDSKPNRWVLTFRTYDNSSTYYYWGVANTGTSGAFQNVYLIIGVSTYTGNVVSLALKGDPVIKTSKQTVKYDSRLYKLTQAAYDELAKKSELPQEWTGTQSEYDELGTYDDNTTYYVVEE